MARTPSSELEARIRSAATALLAEEGAGAVTQRAVAQRAGVSPQSIYNRFSSKHDLLDDVARRGFEELAARLRDDDGVALSSIEDPVENIAEGLRRYRRFATEHPRLYGLMFDAPLADFSLSDRTLSAAFASLEILVDACRRAIDAGALDVGDPLEIAQRLWAAAHGVLRFELTDVGVVGDWDAHYDATVRTMLRGLAP